jgi:hypothetical protein
MGDTYREVPDTFRVRIHITAIPLCMDIRITLWSYLQLPTVRALSLYLPPRNW